jgi:hypothetical protein
MNVFKKIFLVVGSAIFGAAEIAVLWLLLGNLFRYFIKDSFFEVVFLLILSIVGPLATVGILRRFTREWADGKRKDFRKYATIGLVIAMILAAGYMLVIVIVGFGYRNVRM